MATMAVPFEAVPFEIVQTSVNYASFSVSIAQKRQAFAAFCRKLNLVLAFHDIAREQCELVTLLGDGVVQSAPPEALLEVADKVDRLVATTDKLIEKAKSTNFALWNGYLKDIAVHVERLDSLAESFRLSATEHSTNYVHSLVESASLETATANGSWRDFVATLHD